MSSKTDIKRSIQQQSHICVNTLWTGGLDSTARIVELSRKHVIVQPYYISDPNRGSTEYEKAAMKTILMRLNQDPNTKAEILPVKEIPLGEVEPDSHITSSWNRLHQMYHVGSQYDFLARYAKQHGIILEVGIEKGEGRAQNSINTDSRMVQFEDHTGTNYKISRKDSTDDVWNIYRYFTFPLWDKDKHQEVAMMEQLGCSDIIGMTWFCHDPLLGKPCGHCNPCKDARHYGFSWRLSASRTILWYFLRPRQAIRKLVETFACMSFFQTKQRCHLRMK